MAGAAEALPTTLITGFLGQRQDHALNGLLAHPGMANTAVIINEFGEIGLDHLLVESAFEDVVLMKSGCLCCTVRGDLVDMLSALVERRQTRRDSRLRPRAIETTGLADPAPILHILAETPFVAALSPRSRRHHGRRRRMRAQLDAPLRGGEAGGARRPHRPHQDRSRRRTRCARGHGPAGALNPLRR